MGDSDRKTSQKDSWLGCAILPPSFILPAFWNDTVMSGTSAATLAYESPMRIEANTKDERRERRKGKRRGEEGRGERDNILRIVCRAVSLIYVIRIEARIELSRLYDTPAATHTPKSTVLSDLQ